MKDPEFLFDSVEWANWTLIQPVDYNTFLLLRFILSNSRVDIKLDDL